MRHLAWAFGWITLAALGACSAGEPDERVKVDPNSTDPGFQIDDSTLNGDGSRASADAPQCQTEVRAAEAIGLDMFVMLDSSGSMTATVPGVSRIAKTKWDAVRDSLNAFASAPETEGIGVGLQFFPQITPDVPDECTSNADCGSAGGACSNTRCVQNTSFPVGNGRSIPFVTETSATDASFCVQDSDCRGARQACRDVRGLCVLPPGVIAEIPDGTPIPLGDAALCNTDADCAAFPGLVCDEVGFCPGVAAGQPGLNCTSIFDCAPGTGPCSVIPHACTEQTRCEVADYSSPAVPITSGPDRAAAIATALAARSPAGLTPTAPALKGALDFAGQWAKDHADRQVVTVLATDGLPEGFCAPNEIPDVIGIASAGNRGGQPIRTFVIGVFAGEDLQEGARQDLDQIALAGGSQSAIVINTAGDVTSDFLQALNRIRDTSVSCDFKLNSAGLDFEKVNLQVVDGTGSADLVNVGDLTACGTDQQGWFYERDSAGTPTQITVCPSTCRRFMVGGVTANLQIGCATRIR